MNYIEEYTNRLIDIASKINNADSLQEKRSDRMLLLSYIFDVYDTKIYFDEEKAKRETAICIEYLYKKFDFDEWVNRKWSASFQRYKDGEISDILTNQGWNQALVYNSDSQKYANDIVGYMPNNSTKDFDETASREGFRSALQYLYGPYLNVENLKFALFAALKDLLASLSNLKEVKNTKRAGADFIKLDESLYFQFTSLNAKVITEEYEDAKSRVTGGVTCEWLADYLKDELVHLSKTTFMARKIKDYNGGEHGESSVFINLEGLAIKQQKKFIASLLDLCSYKDGAFIFDKNENVGRFIYNYHDKLEENAHTEFYRFKFIAGLVNKDLDKYNNKKSTVVEQQRSFMDYIKFGFKRNHKNELEAICSLITSNTWQSKDYARFANEMYNTILNPAIKPTFKEWYHIFCKYFAITPGNYDPCKLTENKATQAIRMYLEVE